MIVEQMKDTTQLASFYIFSVGIDDSACTAEAQSVVDDHGLSSPRRTPEMHALLPVSAFVNAHHWPHKSPGETQIQKVDMFTGFAHTKYSCCCNIFPPVDIRTCCFLLVMLHIIISNFLLHFAAVRY